MEWISSGFVEKGFESVRRLFDENLRLGREEKAQLCVYHKGKIVVDLWADISSSVSISNQPYDGDTLTNVYSSSKSLAALAIACLVDRGHLNYNAKVTEYWPEFGQNGKEDVLVSDILRHESGLAYFDSALNASDFFTENLKEDSGNAATVMAQQEQHYPSADNKREYHGQSRGVLLNEIFRRCDPAHRTIGEFFKQEIFESGLRADCHLGVKDEHIIARITPLKCWSTGSVLLHSMMPGFISQRVDASFMDFVKLAFLVRKASKEQQLADKKTKSASQAPPFLKELGHMGEGLVNFLLCFNNSEIRRAELPSANFHCSARGMAKVAGCIANQGTLGDVQLLRAETIEMMMANKTKGQIISMGVLSNLSQGGFNQYCILENQEPQTHLADMNRQGYVGWMGTGGSVLQWHPELNIGFGFVPGIVRWYDHANRYAATLQGEVVKCIRNLG